jgi:hypothetical protein
MNSLHLHHIQSAPAPLLAGGHTCMTQIGSASMEGYYSAQGCDVKVRSYGYSTRAKGAYLFRSTPATFHSISMEGIKKQINTGRFIVS